jgi:predicted DNA-binding transcriptional regulator AlpA
MSERVRMDISSPSTRTENPTRTLLRPEEWAATVGISRAKAYALIKQGLPVVRVGAVARIEPGEALAWLRRPPAPKAPLTERADDLPAQETR